LLLTIDERTSDFIDKGFDANIFEVLTNDFYWMNNDRKLVIQAVKDLFKERVFPIGINSNGDGPIKIKVDNIENPYPDMEVYLRDNSTMETYDIKNGSFEINLEKGQYNDKYSVVFEPKVEIEVENEIALNNVLVFAGEQKGLIKIRKPEEMTISNISLFNMIGQQMQAWNSNLNSYEIDLPVNADTGVYIVLMETNKGKVLKKIIIK
jgi:hypothetical protein